MEFQTFVAQLRRFNPQLTSTQARTVWEAFLPFPLQEAIEEQIAVLKARSLNLNGDPYGSESRTRSQAQHWVAYQGSSYPDGGNTPFPGEDFSQLRELEFQHFVEVEDLRRDWERALLLHELIKGLLAGFRPCQIKGVRGALRLMSDGLISARSENETVYRYKATYQISCIWKPADIPRLIRVDPDAGDTFIPEGLEVGVFRSPVEEVGELSSPKFAELRVGEENGTISQ
jgi:hypothetical protein